MKKMLNKQMALLLSMSLALFALFPSFGANSVFGADAEPHGIPLAYIPSWTGSHTGNVDVTVTVVENVYHEGNRSLHITNRTPAAANTYYSVRQTVTVEPNTKYNLSAWVKGSNAGTSWFGDFGKRVYLPTGQFDWLHKQGTYTTGPSQTQLTFLILTENVTDDLWYDEVSLTKEGSTENLLLNASFEEGDVPGTEPVGEDPVDLNHFLSTLGEKNYLPIFRSGEMTVDGNLAEWSPFAAISLPENQDNQVRLPGWNGESDLSMKAKYAYDDEALYVNFVVKDQTHRGVDGAAMWNGDSVQIGFSSDGTAYETEYGLALVGGSPQVWRWLSGSATLPKESVALAASRDETNKVTVYEAKLPWRAIFSDKPGEQFRFSILLNDNDSSVRRGYIQWTDGIGMGKDAAKLGTAQLVADQAGWLSWLDENREIRSGEAFKTSLDLLNTSDSDIVLNVSSAELGVDREVTLPANKARRLALEQASPGLGKHTVHVTVAETSTGKSALHETSFMVYETDEQLIARFDRIASRLPALDAKLEEAKQRGIPTDYERINATVIRSFVQYGKDDVAHQLTERATYVAEELERLHDDAMAKLEGYLNGSLEASAVPRYRTGNTRIGIDGYSFVADKYDSSTGQTERGPVIFTGYGHFDSVRKDIPKFEDYGTNVIQVEIGPNSVIVPSEAWTVWRSSKVNGVQAEITVDRSVKRSGKGALRITNRTPLAPNTYASVSQNVPVAPNTTYEIKAWVKGENAKNVWFPGGLNWKTRHKVPEGTYDWTEVSVPYTTSANETTMNFIILSENAGTVWFDDISMTAAGSEENVLQFPGFDDDAPSPDKGYVMSETAIRSDILQVLDNSKQHNIAVNLLLSPHYFPDWAKEKWPELKSNATEFIQFQFDSPKAREIIKDYLQTIIPLIKDYTSLQSITMTNEPVYASSEDPAYHTPKFRLYLKDVYDQDIGKLNQVYGTSYGSFDDVPMPHEYSSTPAYYDWFIYNNQMFTGWHKWMADIIHEMAPDLPVQAKVMNGILGGDKWGIDFEMMSELSQINGNDASSYLANGMKDYLREFMYYDFQSSLKQAPVFNSEHHIIPDGDDNYVPEQAAHVNTQLWQSAVHGRSGSAVWVWDRTYDTSSVIAGSVMHRPDVAAVVGKTNLDLNRLVEEVTALQHDRPQIAILYSVPAVLYEVRNAYPDSVRRLYDAISLSGVNVGFITEKQIREGKADAYKAIVVPQQRYLESGTLEKLDSYAKTKGKLFVTGTDSLKFNEHGQPLEASVRTSVYEHSTVIESSLSAQQLREWVMSQPIYKKLSSVVLIDEATMQPVIDVEWRSVKYKGKWLVNMANYGEASRTVSVYANGKKVEQIVNLIDGEAISGGAVLLPQRTPKLLQWDAGFEAAAHMPGD